MKHSKRKRVLAAVLACILSFSAFAVFPASAGDAVTVSDNKLTEVVFGEIFTDADKGTSFGGNLYLEKTLGPVYFDGVRNGDFFEFDINVEKAGDYHFCFFFGWLDQTGTYDVSFDGGEPIQLKNSVSGKGWRHWVNSTEAQVSLTAGAHTVRVTMGSDGPNLYSMKIAPMNIDLGTGAEVGTITPKESIAMTDSGSPSGANAISDSAAIQFNTTEVFDGMDISSASWNNNLGSLRVSLSRSAPSPAVCSELCGILWAWRDA